jgi:hypothetical protein
MGTWGRLLKVPVFLLGRLKCTKIDYGDDCTTLWIYAILLNYTFLNSDNIDKYTEIKTILV